MDAEGCVCCLLITNRYCLTGSKNGLNKLHLHRVAYSGEENGRSLLTKEQVLEIKQKYIPYKHSAKKLAKEYNVSESCITHILNNTSWKKISIK